MKYEKWGNFQFHVQILILNNEILQQQAALMAAATAQGTYINPMAALTGQLPHAALNGMPNSVVPPSSGKKFSPFSSKCLRMLWHGNLLQKLKF